MKGKSMVIDKKMTQMLQWVEDKTSQPINQPNQPTNKIYYCKILKEFSGNTYKIFENFGTDVDNFSWCTVVFISTLKNY